jgi:hypothetical protein
VELAPFLATVLQVCCRFGRGKRSTWLRTAAARERCEGPLGSMERQACQGGALWTVLPAALVLLAVVQVNGQGDPQGAQIFAHRFLHTNIGIIRINQVVLEQRR